MFLSGSMVLASISIALGEVVFFVQEVVFEINSAILGEVVFFLDPKLI